MRWRANKFDELHDVLAVGHLLKHLDFLHAQLKQLGGFVEFVVFGHLHGHNLSGLLLSRPVDFAILSLTDLLV